jgi:signal transduction histidine kinase
MKFIVESRMGRRFVGTFALLSLPIFAAGWFGLRSATRALEKETRDMLHVASHGAEAQTREFLNSLGRTTQAQALEDEVQSALTSPADAAGHFSHLLPRVQARAPEIKEIYCLNTRGSVIASSTPEMLGKDESGSAEFKQGIMAYYPGDIVRDAETQVIRWRMSAPVKETASGQTLGVVVVGIDPGTLSGLTTGKRVLSEGAEEQSFRIGETGETYLVNSNRLLLTESRFASNSILRLKVDTAPVRAAFEERKEILDDYKDYRGVPVTGASAILETTGWLLVTEIDRAEAFAPIHTLRRTLIAMWLSLGLIAVFVARHFAKRIIDPLRVASEANRALADGDQQHALVAEENLPRDEIGDFIRNRNINVKKLFERERELLKEQQRRAEAAAALERVSYSMVHDMRAPLRAICAFSDLIVKEDEERLTADQKDYLGRMKNACHRMDDLIRDRLKYSSLLTADMQLYPVNVPEVIRNAIGRNEELRARECDIEIDESMPLVRGNAAVLEECFSALLDNAFKYAKPDVRPKVRLWAERNNGWARILIEDNGIGMSKEFQERAFGIFQKGTTIREATGIGLALVRVAVERMGGRVGVSSEEGKGSRFWIELSEAPAQ